MYDERLEPNPGFITTAAAWGSVIAIPAIDFLQGALKVPPDEQFVTESLAETWARGWQFFAVVGAIALTWRVDTYEEASYDSDGCGGIATLTRLLVELDSRAIPLVVKDTWKTAILAELETTIPLLRSKEHQRANPVAEG